MFIFLYILLQDSFEKVSLNAPRSGETWEFFGADGPGLPLKKDEGNSMLLKAHINIDLRLVLLSTVSTQIELGLPLVES